MPHYFFDVTDRDGRQYDSNGLDLPDLGAARQVLEMTLPRLSAERALRSGPQMTMLMIVRDAFEQDVLQATLDWTITRRLEIDRRQPPPRTVFTPALVRDVD